MNIETLKELDNTIKNRLEFLLLNIQDILIEELRLDENDFEVIDNELVYKNIVKVIPSIGQASINIYKNKVMKHIIYKPITIGELMKENVPYKDIVIKFKEALNESK